MSTAARLGQAITIAFIVVAVLWAFIAVLVERRRLREARALLLAQLATQALDEIAAPTVHDLEVLPAAAFDVLASDVLESYRSTPLL